jgi:hypothetical protein
MSTLNVDKVDPSSGTALEIGTSGDTITVPSGATLVVAGTTEITGTNNVQRPNAAPLIINGNMSVAQRGTSFTTSDPAANENEWSADRFTINTGAIGAYTTINEALTSGNAFEDGFVNASRIDCTTAVASPDAGDYFYGQYGVEAQDCMAFKKGTPNAEKATLAFWVKSNVTGTGQVNMRDEDNNRMVSGTYTIDVTNTWEKKIINFPADTTGAFADDNGVGIRFEWWLGSGTTYSSGTAPTAWETRANGDRDASGTLNINDNTANDWAITGVQLEVGEYTSTTIPPFQHESYGDNLARCQRYAYVISGDNQVLGFGFGKGSDNVVGPVIFPTTMRSAPTTTTTTATTAYKFQGSKPDGTGQDQNIDGSSNVLEQAGTRGITYKMDGLSTVGGGSTGFFRTNSASAKIVFDSEL